MTGIALAYLTRLGTPMLTHEKVTLEAVARSVAQIKHYEFAGWYDITNRYSDDIYFVPDDTLMPDEAAFLGIRSPSDFFGGGGISSFCEDESNYAPARQRKRGSAIRLVL